MSAPTYTSARDAAVRKRRRGAEARSRELVEAAVSQPLLIVTCLTLGADRRRHLLAHAASGRRLSGRLADASRHHDAVAGPRRGRSRASDHVPIETELNGLPNLVVTRSVSLYGLSSIDVTFTDKHRSLLRAAAGVRATRRRELAGRRVDRRRGAVLTVGPRLSLRHPEHRSLGDGSARPAGLGARQGVSSRPRRGRRRVARRRDDAVSGAGRPHEARRRGPRDQRRDRCARREQQQRRRRLHLRGRPVHLRARPRPLRDARRHRQRRHRREEQRAGPRQGHRHRGDRLRAAARPVRLQQAGQRRRRHHPHADGRAGADRPEARRGEDAPAERPRAPEGREGRAVLRPQRSRRADDAHRRGQSVPRHRARHHRADRFPVRHPSRGSSSR